MNSVSEKQSHELRINMRKDMEISGVKDVEAFDDTAVSLNTVCGYMTIEGSELRVGTLDIERGILSLSGKIDAVFYSVDNNNEKKGFFGRLFR